MSILTDRQIRVRCQWQGKKLVQIRDRGDVKVGETTILVDPREAARAHAMAAHTFGDGELMPFYVDDATAEEAGFTPMITPFRPEQIRRIQREATPQELALFSVQSMLTQEEQMAALKAITPSAEGVGYVDEPDPRKPALRIQQKVISSGLSSMGYDVTLARDFKIFTNVNSEIIDPLNMNERIYHQNIDVDYCIIPPNSYILGHTEEWFDIPKDILALCLGKSTYARCGAIVNATPIEPGFKGRVVIEISNATNLPLKVYAGQGVAQFLFLQSTEDCEVGYGDRDNGKGGKYQNQTGLQTALV